MPSRRLPTSFVATRDLLASGHSVARGATVTTANAAAWLGKRLDAYLSRGWLVASPSSYPETQRRQGLAPLQKRHFNPTHLSPTERNSIS